MLWPRTRSSRSQISAAEENSLPFNMRPQIFAGDDPGGLDRFRTVVRIVAGDAFAPAGDAVDDGFYQHHAAFVDAVHAGLKGGDQFHGNFAKD